MRTLAGAVALVLVSAGCAMIGGGRDRDDVVRTIVASTVQLRAEREGGVRRAGSGIVLSADATGSWILTTRHLVEPQTAQTVVVIVPGGGRKSLRAELVPVSSDIDLALLRVDGLRLPPVRLKDTVHLGDPVWVVAFPWGRRLTMVSGVVSQLASENGETRVEGSATMVDASVSYGASGGGVYDAGTGELVAVVESHRTARVMLPDESERTFDIPVPGETGVISAGAIRRFLAASPLATRTRP